MFTAKRSTINQSRPIAIPFGEQKLEWLRYPMLNKFWWYDMKEFTNVMDGETNGQRMTA